MIQLDIMSSCKHFVMSNSTFNWWAQHCASNEEKIVVAPKKWINIEDGSEEADRIYHSIYEDNWVIM